VQTMASQHPRLREGFRMRALLRALREQVKPTGPSRATSHRAPPELVEDLRAALDERQFSLEYQPIVQVDTRAPIGAEALLRWDRPGVGRTPPDAFIPVLEDAALMNEVEAWVLEQACRDAATWPAHLHVAVNLSARRLDRPELKDAVTVALERSSLPPQRLVLEVTETAVPIDCAAAVEQLYALVHRGVRLALDDFGTGYASLAQLRDFPVDAIKVDRRFIAGLGSSPEDTAIVAALLRLAQNLGLIVVAEGVETDAQAAMLRDLGCPHGQGFLWSPPVPAELISNTLHALDRDGPR
jgi:EAL domain-containing protein (putative c-di-GMP-specific phosphodiesterase class I)